MDSLRFVILVIIQQVSLAGGAVVTLTFASKGYIGHSIVFQCKTDTPHIVSPSAIWYFKGVVFSSSSSRFSEIATSDGFNLTISNLTTADEGDYACGIDFDSSSDKTLGIVYNTQSKDINIQKGASARTIIITMIAYPDPTYNVTVTEVKNGVATPVTNVNWASAKTTQANDVIIVTLTANNFTKDTYNITVTVTSTWPIPIIVQERVSFATITATNDTTNECKLELGLGLGLSLGIQSIIITCIVVVIFVYKGTYAYKFAYKLGLVLGLGIGITFQVSWIIIVSLISTGNQCKLEVGLGLGLGSGIPCVITLTVVVILVFKGIPSTVEIGKGILKGLLFASVIGIFIVFLIPEKLEENPTKPTEEPQEKPPEPIDPKNKTKTAGPPEIHKGNQNKVQSEITNKKTNGRPQPLPPGAVVTGDIPKPRAQPPPPEKIDVKDPIQRGISANFDDKQGLPTETPGSSKLPPIKDTLKEPKKKRKKKNKKKGQINEENPEEEMVELTSKRTLPKDRSDGD